MWWSVLFSSPCRKVSGCPALFLSHCHGLASVALQLVFLSLLLRCTGWLCVLCRDGTVQAQCFSLDGDGVMALERRTVAAALSKGSCREDVDWTSEYTAWMDGSLKTVQLYSAVLENR